ncbi:MAG: hypothetical protein QGF67_10820 [Lentisphaeria bacterium]|jgi:hypothetical protein|nr:hypothetical protein [Lentisphaeria bacterium]MDP7741926.1 hypothetical protein [Lentisphaeria bacterium]
MSGCKRKFRITAGSNFYRIIEPVLRLQPAVKEGIEIRVARRRQRPVCDLPPASAPPAPQES